MFFKPKTHADAIAPLAGIVKNLRAIANEKDMEIEHHQEKIDEHNSKSIAAYAERSAVHHAANKIEALFA